MALTSAQIVSLACSIAKCPGYTVQGGQFLNQVLSDLVLHRDLKVNRKTSSITVQAGSNGPFNLEADYLRTYDLFYTQNNLPYFLQQAGMDMFDSMFKDPSQTNYPYMYATDLSPQAAQNPGLLYVFPQSSGQITLTHRYMVNQPDISTPESSSTIPWMQDQSYLIKATAARLMMITDDVRQSVFDAECENMLRTHLIMSGDEQPLTHSIKLDPWRFRNSRHLRDTKQTG